MKQPGKRPRFKVQRRLQVEIPGLGKSGALERRPYPPGEHGQRRKKYSEYGLQLEEKQKVRVHYGLREEQMKRFVKEAKRAAQINWVEKLINLLEKRADSIVFRLGFAPSIPAARQLVSHGKVYVNGKRLDIKSAILNVGDRVTLSPDAYTGQTYLHAKENPRLPVPDYLRKEAGADGVEAGTIKEEPAIGDFPVPFNEGLFTSYYNLKG